jgi:hypothetical protein
MATLLQRLRMMRVGWSKRESQMIQIREADHSRQMMPPPMDIAPNDPIVAYFLSAPGAVEIDKLHFDSPALSALKDAGVKLAIPLVSQGELVGLLNLGPRKSEQDYSTDDRGLLNTLATQSAPAVRVAQLVRDQQAQARENERIQHELRVAQLIQKTLLPKDLPALPGWQVNAYYQAARQVGGDFKENFPKFWPKDNRFYAPLTGIAPGEVALLNLSMPVGMRLSTGVLVLYADEESFTLMTPQGHIFAGWITFSAYQDDSCTIAQAQVLIRANDPAYEISFRLGGAKKEDTFWQDTLTSLAEYFGVKAQAQTQKVCVDPKLQWSQAKNIWHNSAIRTTLYTVSTPIRWVGQSFWRKPEAKN